MEGLADRGTVSSRAEDRSFKVSRIQVGGETGRCSGVSQGPKEGRCRACVWGQIREGPRYCLEGNWGKQSPGLESQLSYSNNVVLDSPFPSLSLSFPLERLRMLSHVLFLPHCPGPFSLASSPTRLASLC